MLVWVSLELLEILMDKFDGQIHVPTDGLLLHFSPDHPAVGHLLELHASRLLSAEFLSQQLLDLSSGLHVGRVVFGGQEEGRAPDLAGQLHIVSSEHLLHSQRGMRSSDGDEFVVLGCHLEGLPDSPAEADGEKMLDSLALKVRPQFLELLAHDCLVLSLDVLHDSRAHFAMIGRLQYLGEVDIVVQRGEEIGHVAVPAAGGSENIGEDDQRALSVTNVVDRHAVDREVLALGLVVGRELLPGAFRTALHILGNFYREHGRILTREMWRKEKEWMIGGRIGWIMEEYPCIQTITLVSFFWSPCSSCELCSVSQSPSPPPHPIFSTLRAAFAKTTQSSKVISDFNSSKRAIFPNAALPPIQPQSPMPFSLFPNPEQKSHKRMGCLQGNSQKSSAFSFPEYFLSFFLKASLFSCSVNSSFFSSTRLPSSSGTLISILQSTSSMNMGPWGSRWGGGYSVEPSLRLEEDYYSSMPTLRLR